MTAQGLDESTRRFRFRFSSLPWPRQVAAICAVGLLPPERREDRDDPFPHAFMAAMRCGRLNALWTAVEEQHEQVEAAK